MLRVLVCTVLFACCTAATADNNTGSWKVGNCISVQMEAHLTILPDSKDVNNTVLVSIPALAKSAGVCSDSNNQTGIQTIDLVWEGTDEKVNKPLSRYINITFKFNETAASPYYGVFRMDGYYETKYFNKNVTDDKNVTHNETFIQFVTFTTFERTPLELQTPANMTYMCQDIGLISMHSELHDTSEPRGASGEKLPNVTFTATDVMLNAFRPDGVDPDQFQASLDCSYRPSDVVPIIVGCALAGTVVLVLVAYLVGRRRNRAAGYQSV
jgi:hypothetical protein